MFIMFCLFQSQRVHLILLLPDSVDNINEILTSLTKENLLETVRSLPLRETEVALPQLAILTKDLDLAPFLHRIGLDTLFTNPHSHILSIKQNVYFSTSFVAVNSVGSITTLLGKLHFDLPLWFDSCPLIEFLFEWVPPHNLFMVSLFIFILDGLLGDGNRRLATKSWFCNKEVTIRILLSSFGQNTV